MGAFVMGHSFNASEHMFVGGRYKRKYLTPAQEFPFFGFLNSRKIMTDSEIFASRETFLQKESRAFSFAE